ncbi:MAG: hypothetical protein ACKVHX_12875 [Alphaproteobacteria bacterium]|jgi:hypothetical protein
MALRSESNSHPLVTSSRKFRDRNPIAIDWGWLLNHALWLKPVLAPIAIWLDDVLGYGNPINAKKWWLDLEVMGDETFKYDPKNYTVAAKGANRPNINPRRRSPKTKRWRITPPRPCRLLIYSRRFPWTASRASNTPRKQEPYQRRLQDAPAEAKNRRPTYQATRLKKAAEFSTSS